MPRGRPPKPPELERLQGNPGHRPPRSATILAGKVTDQEPLPRPPRGMSPRARRAWREIVELLVAAGIYDRADRLAVENAARSLARVRQVGKLVDELPENLLAETARGTSVHPYVGHERELQTALRLHLVELGLTVVGRSRLDLSAGKGGRAPAPDRRLGEPGRALRVVDGGRDG